MENIQNKKNPVLNLEIQKTINLPKFRNINQNILISSIDSNNNDVSM